MKEFLRDASLSQYSGIFEEMGYDSLDHLLNMTSENLLELKQLVNMKQGHFVRMKANIGHWRASVTPSSSSTPSTPASSVPMIASPESDAYADVGPYETGPYETGPVDDGPRDGPRDGPSRNGPRSLNRAHKCVFTISSTGPKTVIAAGLQTMVPGPPSFFATFD